ncbi:MAG: prepilin-type N-terminal cleavage/methylation domain-containing protein [bacterium]
MKNRGITIIEMVISLSIFAVVSIIIASLYIYHSNLYRIESADAGIKTQRAVFIKNFRETAEASSAVVATMTIGGTAYASSSSTVIFQTPSIGADKNIISNKFDYIVFYKTANDLYMETSADAASQRKSLKRKLSDKANALTFRYDTTVPSSASLVTASLSLKAGELFQDTISSSASLRNKQ